MGWQAQTGLHFDLAGGFAVVPAPDGRSAFVAPPSEVVATLDSLSASPESLVSTPLPSTQGEVASVRASIVRWKVGVTVVTQVGTDPVYSAAFFTAVYGREPTFRLGAWVWTGPPSSTRSPLSPTTLAACAAQASPHLPLSAPLCVMDRTSASDPGPSSHPLPAAAP